MRAIFEDRYDAGSKLAEEIISQQRAFSNPIVLGIPRGGLAVGYPVAQKLTCPLEPVMLRKLPIPFNREMGFGTVDLDKKVILNEDLIKAGYVSEKTIQPIVEEVYEEVLRRDKVYRSNRPFPQLKNRSVLIADDGLATGFTMLAAVRFARKREAEEIVVIVPVAHHESYNLVKKEADDIICLHISRGFSFAVASFYMRFPDMSDVEVIKILKKARLHSP
jgi:putative phosphoribosyl transferase